MKNKAARCSAGHGTGVTPDVPLREILERDRVRTRRKQWLRFSHQRSAKAKRRSNLPALGRGLTATD